MRRSSICLFLFVGVLIGVSGRGILDIQSPLLGGEERWRVQHDAPNLVAPAVDAPELAGLRNVSVELFAELEELSRLVDIAYCVGVSGIWPPFRCAGRCGEFEGYEIIDTWNTGPLLSDSCGYIALDHNGDGRIIIAFRGTYSVANTIADLSTIPQEYEPYPADPDTPEDPEDSPSRHHYLDLVPRPWRWFRRKSIRVASTVFSNAKCALDDRSRPQRTKPTHPKGPKCTNCTVHSGFFTSWINTRGQILPHITRLHDLYPAYTLHLVGHSLGGAVAALASLELSVLGHEPIVTTFGEPRIGNAGLRDYLDSMFALGTNSKGEGSADGNGDAKPVRYRRLTHVDDPVPLLPLAEWSYRMHGGEIYIKKKSLQPGVDDVKHCAGDEDPACIAGGEVVGLALLASLGDSRHGDVWRREYDMMEELDREAKSDVEAEVENDNANWGLPSRYRMWQLFFAHRDYFWRLGLCVPGGDPYDWGREKYGKGKGAEKSEEL